jgi:RNA polymerase subunit RPABC4/transcription elongation factor Spt4
MSDPLAKPHPGRTAPVLVLCRQCIRYVYEGTTICPHCGGDSREISDRYREGGYLAIETIQRIARAAEWRRG